MTYSYSTFSGTSTENNGREKGGTSSALRAEQIDAQDLDLTLISFLQKQLDQILADANSSFLLFFSYQIKRFLPIFYFLPQIFSGHSPGQKLLNIRYRRFSLLRVFFNYAIAHFLPPFVEILKFRISRSQLLIDRILKACHLAEFIHFCYFIGTRVPLRLSEKLLALDIIYANTPKLGHLNFSSLNRQLIGHSFVQLLIIVTPLFALLKRHIFLLISRLNSPHVNRVISSAVSNRNALVRCAHCSQVAVCAVRAIVRRKMNGREEWRDYCHLCLCNLDPSQDKYYWEPSIC